MAWPAIATTALGAAGGGFRSTGGQMMNQLAGMGMNTLFGGLTTGNWGGTSKERKNQIHDIRTLRRREYGDMMHSMRKAGLNPILASGAQPGHSAAASIPTQMQTGDLAAHRQAGVAEGTAPSVRQLNTAKAQQANEEKLNTIYGRASILQQYDETKARIANIESSTYNNAIQSRLAEKKGHLTDAETDRLKSQQGMLDETGGYGTSLEGALRQFIRPWLGSALDDFRKK